MYVIPDKLLDTILVEGPFFLIRIILNAEDVTKDFYDFYENLGSDLQTAGTYLGKMFSEFIPQDPWDMLGEPQPLGFFNPLNFTDGFIMGL